MTFDGRIDLGSDKEHRLPLEVIPHKIIAFLETFGRAEETHHIEIGNRLSFKMISDGWRVPLEKKEILQAKGRGIEKFGLKSQSVSVAACEVIDDLDPSFLQEGAYREGSKPHDGILKIWNVDGVQTALPSFRMFIDLREIDSFGGLEFSRHHKFT
jgi:hypothetical protein